MQPIPDQQQAIINDSELRAWADRLNVTKVQLKAAINAVGSSTNVVEAYLYRKQKARQSSN